MDHQEDAKLTALIRDQAKYYEAPQDLRNRIGLALERFESDKAAHRSSRWLGWQQWWGMGAAFATGVVLSVAITFFYAGSGQQDRLVEQVLDGHVRSLMVAHLSDVASSDQHTVKPWLSSKLDFSPPVHDLAAQGFPLIGGRLDYIDERPVAALVYRRNLHIINVFVWPLRNNASFVPIAKSRQGFNVTSWAKDGMQFWATSDIQSAELQEFAQLLRNQPKA